MQASDILAVLDPHPSGMRTADVAVRLGASLRTTQRQVAELEDAGAIERIGRGLVRCRRPLDAADAPLRNHTGGRIWEVLTRERIPAYVSGLDVVGRYAHQAIVAFPHLVVCHPSAMGDCDWQLARAGFDIRDRRRGIPNLAEPDRVVFLRGARGFHISVYGVHDRVASEALAWLDLYREASRRRYPIGAGDLGQMLTQILPMPSGTSRLRTLARRHGLEDVTAILDGAMPRDPFAKAVAQAYEA